MQSMSAFRGGAVALGLVVAVVLSVLALGQGDDLLAEIRAELVPEAGTETSYGMPLSVESLSQLVDWWYTLVPAVEDQPAYVDGLRQLVAPCCDDNTAFKCCCEQGDNACNLIRSGKGLAAYLILELDYQAEAVAASVLEWFRFVRPDYYVAAELAARGLDPQLYGLTTHGSCYRGLCDVAISEGGCGGMLELFEPAIDVAGS